jgi:hypothetical protein
MTSTHCPDCHVAVQVAPSAREGRCQRCRLQRQRAHSQPRMNPQASFASYLERHQAT